MIEEWRGIPSVPKYEASSLGRLRSVKYESKMPYGGNRFYGGNITLGTWNKTRYVIFIKGYGNKKVARLICEAFHGSPPFPNAVCMHIDENARNNRPDNLRWGTQKENLNFPGFIAYCKNRIGENSPRVKSGNV
jgi:hypothetical protein